MAIEIRLDLVMVKKKMSLTELAEKVGISMTNLSLLKTGKVKGIRFNTLDAICRELQCQPGDILEYIPDFVWRTPSWISTGRGELMDSVREMSPQTCKTAGWIAIISGILLWILNIFTFINQSVAVFFSFKYELLSIVQVILLICQQRE
jgi:putative transcriptional regulator